MLPDSQPRPTRSYPPDRSTPPPEPRTDHLVTSYALTLFTLGVTVGLLALLGRIAQEMQHSVLSRMTRGGLRVMPFSTGRSSLPPMVHDLSDPVVRFVALGFAVCAVGILFGAGLWLFNGKPSNPRERRWTLTGAWSVLWLVIGMGGTLFVAGSGTRITLLSVSLALALAGFVMLVVMVAAYALRSPPT